MPLQLEIVTPERLAYSDTVDEVQLPGAEGEMGVLPHHAPLLATLGVGELRIRKGGDEESFAIVGGFVQVRPDKVVVMAETADMASEIDLERAQEDYTRVMSTLRTLEENADKQVVVGGLKIRCGSLLLISALLGPQAPVALGVAGIACTVGTSVYEHWDQIEDFFDKEDHSRPSILDIMPDDRVIIRLDDGRVVRPRGGG